MNRSFVSFFARVFDNRRIIKLRYGLLGVLKGDYGWLVHFLYRASYASSFAMKITGEWQNYSFLSNKICLPSIISIATNHKNELWKTVRLTSFQKPKLQSVLIFLNLSIRASFCIPSSNFFHFNVSLNSVAVTLVWILINYVTQLL